jgi:hypothetical protein
MSPEDRRPSAGGRDRIKVSPAVLVAMTGPERDRAVAALARLLADLAADPATDRAAGTWSSPDPRARWTGGGRQLEHTSGTSTPEGRPTWPRAACRAVGGVGEIPVRRLALPRPSELSWSTRPTSGTDDQLERPAMPDADPDPRPRTPRSPTPRPRTPLR